jgi:hypothetical protein
VFQRFVQNVSSVPNIRCKHSDLDIAHVSNIYYKNMFQMFKLFQFYVTVNVFMLQVANVLSGCYMCFTHMLQVYVLDVSSVAYVCCIKVFHVAYLSCYSESQGARGVTVARHGYRGMGAWRAGVLRTGRARGRLRARVRGGMSGLKSRQIGWATTLRVRGECSRHAGVATGRDACVG